MNKFNLEDVLKALYDSEIDHIVRSQWDAGYSVGLGCGYSGVYEYQEDVPSLKDVPKALHEMAIKYYPNSGYADNFRKITML